MNADEAEKMIEELNPDLLFLDIQMPGRTGFSYWNRLSSAVGGVHHSIWWVRIESFEVNALDYLLKANPTW